MPRKLLWILAAFAFGCRAEGTPVKSDNESVVVERLVVIEDCRVYRIEDGLRSVYTTICGPVTGERTTGAAWRETCGKNCTRAVAVTTTRVR